MKSVAAAIYAAITISFLRKVIRKTCPESSGNRAAARTTMELKPNWYELAIEVDWNRGPDMPVSCSCMVFRKVFPPWTGEEEISKLSDYLNASHVSRFKEILNAELDKKFYRDHYRCHDIAFFYVDTDIGVDDTMPDDIKEAIFYHGLYINNEISNFLSKHRPGG